MRLILVVAALMAALMCTPASAKLFDRLKAPVPFTISVAPAVQREAVTAPKLKRLGPLKRLKLLLSARSEIRKLRVPK